MLPSYKYCINEETLCKSKMGSFSRISKRKQGIALDSWRDSLLCTN